VTPIRRPLTGLLLLFVGALAIDRVALSGADERTIQTYAYFVALAFVTAPLLIRGFRRTGSGTFLAMAGATALGLQVLSARLTNDPYQALVETAFILIATALAHRLATALERLDQAINSVVFGDSPALPLDGRKAANEILGEMARSRRHLIQRASNSPSTVPPRKFSEPSAPGMSTAKWPRPLPTISAAQTCCSRTPAPVTSWS